MALKNAYLYLIVHIFMYKCVHVTTVTSHDLQYVCQYKANNAVDTYQLLLTLADNSVGLTSPDAAPAAQPGQEGGEQTGS